MASVNIKPLEDKILVQANEAETTTASGLVIPDTAKEKPQEGTVVAVGEGRVNEQATASRSTSRRVTRSSTPSTAEPRSSTPARST